MKRFIDQTGIRDYLTKLNLPLPKSNAGYELVDIIEAFG